jgi:uncharacterized C2H2 Zn-finger protein
MCYVFSILCLVQAYLAYEGSGWCLYFVDYCVDTYEHRYLSTFAAIAGAIICLYLGMKHDKDNDTPFICPKCEDVFAYRDVKPLCNCPKCGVPLMPLKGYFKRKAWEERQKEKNANTNA